MRKFVLPILFIFIFSATANAATVTCTIGSGKHYAAPSDWADNSYGATTGDCGAGVTCTSADDCIGEMYGSIPATAHTYIDDSTPVSIKLTAASGEEHDGTPGSGTKLTGAYAIISSVSKPTEISWIEVDGNGGNLTYIIQVSSATGLHKIHHNILHNTSKTDWGTQGIYVSGTGAHEVHNNLVYSITQTTGTNASASGIYLNGSAAFKVYNNTIHSVTGNSITGTNAGVYDSTYASNNNVVNNIITDVSATSGTPACVRHAGTVQGTMENNACNYDSTSTYEQADYENVTINYVGSGDYHLDTGTSADLFNTGTDFGTTPSDIEFDLFGRDRDTQGDSWSFGAAQHVATSGTRRNMVIQ